MITSPVQRRWLAVGATAAILGGVLAVVALQAPRAADESGRSAGKNVPGRKPGEWPLFGGSVSRNLVNLVDTNIPTDWDVAKGAAGNIKWSQNLGSKAYGGPIISGGKIFIGTNNGQPRDPSVKGDKGVVMCFDQQTGKFLWQSVFDKLKAGRVSDWPEEGICSSPVVQGDRLWYICNRAEVICSSTDNGKIDWRLDMIGKLNVFPHNLTTCSPLVVGDTLFVITSNGVDEGHINIPQPESPSFLAINKNTGAVLWSSNLPSVNLIELRKKDPTLGIQTMKDKGQILMHGQWSNPVYAEPNGKPMIIFPGGNGWMYGFNPSNGELLWKFDCNPKSAFYVLGPKATRNDFLATPVVWENKLYIAVGQDPEHQKGVGHLWCIDIGKEPKNPDKRLSPFPDPAENPKFDPKDPRNKDSGLVWHYGGFNPTKKPRPWVFGRSMSTCCVHDGLVYAAEYDGWLHCLDARTGSLYWDHNMEADTWSSPYYVDGKIHLGNEVGDLLIFEHGKKKNLINTVSMANGGMVRATPVVVGGVLYAMTENPCRLYAVTPGGK